MLEHRGSFRWQDKLFFLFLFPRTSAAEEDPEIATSLEDAAEEDATEEDAEIAVTLEDAAEEDPGIAPSLED